MTVIMFGLGYAITSSFSPSAELMVLAHGKDVPDTQFWRTAGALYEQLTDYGQTGIQLYLTRISPVDLFIPIAQAMFLSVTITLIFRNTLDSNASAWQWLNTLPFAAMFGDYLENTSTVIIMLNYPKHLNTLASAATWFTAIKFIFSIASIGLIIIGGFRWLAKRLQSR